MTNISQLFSSTVELQEFNTKNINHIPSFGSIIYTVFLDRSEYIYVGIGGLSGKSVQERNPRSRIIQHAQGRRNGDQFCIYIQDFYVIPSIINSQYTPKKGYLDMLTKEFIQKQSITIWMHTNFSDWLDFEYVEFAHFLSIFSVFLKLKRYTQRYTNSQYRASAIWTKRDNWFCNYLI